MHFAVRILLELPVDLAYKILQDHSLS